MDPLTIEHIATLVSHDDAWPEFSVVPPIVQTSLFTYSHYQEIIDSFTGAVRRPIYSRGDNPTVRAFEQRLAALEGGEDARGYASGMGAISGAVLTCVNAGDRLVCVRHVYPDAWRFFETFLPRFNVSVTYVDGSDLSAIARALPGAKALYLESPTSWMMQTQDLDAIATLAKSHGVTTLIDNSWASPVFQQPLRHGIDIVIHSASKYLSGHSDVVAGAIVASAEHIARINASTYSWLGAKMSPFDAWLLLRGMRTLPLRMLHHQKSGLAMAERLREHPDVVEVCHPAFSPHGECLRGYSGLFSIELAAGLSVEAFCNALRLFKLGVSWGGHESLCFPAKPGYVQSGGSAQRFFGVPEQMVRLHIGLEGVDDLWQDIEFALAAAKKG